MGELSEQLARVLIDSGSMGDFVSTAFIEKHKLEPQPVSKEQLVKVANGKLQPISGILKGSNLKLGRYQDKIDLDTTNLEDYDVILGKPWLTKLNPQIDQKKNVIKIRHKRHYIKLKAKEKQDTKSIKIVLAMYFKKILRKGNP